MNPDILVLGLGNDILTDDAVGLHVVRQLRAAGTGAGRVDLRETTEMGLALLDFFTGYREVILIDSIQTGTAPAGTIHEFAPEAPPRPARRTPHFLGVGDTLALGRLLDLPMPERVRILAVEVADPFTLGTELTPAVQRALPSVVQRVLIWLRPDAGGKADGRSQRAEDMGAMAVASESRAAR